MQTEDEGLAALDASGVVVGKAQYDQAVEDWARNDEQVLAENQRLADEVARVQDELVTQNRLYRKVGAERDEKQFEVERLRRWVDRFREALKPPTEGQTEGEAALVETAMRAVEADGAGQWPTVAGCLHGEVLRLRGLLADRGPVAESVPATPDEDAALWAVALDRVRRDKGVRHTLEDVIREMDALDNPSPEASSAASHIVHSVTLSSDTGVMGEWQAFCHGCEQRASGDLSRVELWKDQHLADTLVPSFGQEAEQ